MDPAESSRIRPTASLRRKKAATRAPIRRPIRESDDVGGVEPELRIETPQLTRFGSAREETENSDSEGSSDETERLEYRGPDDRSLLKSFRTHVAFYILHNQERGLLRCLSHTKKIDAWSLMTPEPNIRFMELVQASSLFPLVEASYQYISAVEVSAFVERWHPETNTFHMPFGEMTITLDDVTCLLGLPVVGKSVRQHASVASRTSAEILTQALGVSHEEALNALHVKGGVSIKLDWLKKKFCGVVDTDTHYKIRCAARAYLLYVLGSTIFADKSCTLVPVEYLTLLQDLEEVHMYAWGAAALAWLYRQLGHASRVGVKQISGYLTLLQAWIFAHFPTFVPIINQSFSDGDPIACRWLSRKDTRASTAHIQIIRSRLDNLSASQVTWDPYRDYREIYPFSEISFFTGTLKMHNVVEPYHPVRVLRQFGRKQYVPPSPFTAERDKQGKTSNQYLVKYPYLEELWTNWPDHVLSQAHRGEIADYPSECTPGYITWLSTVSQRFLRSAPAEPNMEETCPDVYKERNSRASALIQSYKDQGDEPFRREPGAFMSALTKIQACLSGCHNPDDQVDEEATVHATPGLSDQIRSAQTTQRRHPPRKTRRH